MYKYLQAPLTFIFKKFAIVYKHFKTELVYIFKYNPSSKTIKYLFIPVHLRVDQ